MSTICIAGGLYLLLSAMLVVGICVLSSRFGEAVGHE